jgi:hypothetical protein
MLYVDDIAPYRAGACNIGPAEIARRRRAGLSGLLTAGTLAILMFIAGTDPVLRWIVAVPLYLGLLGMIQARLRFCVAFGLAGLRNFGPLGAQERVGGRAPIGVARCSCPGRSPSRRWRSRRSSSPCRPEVEGREDARGRVRHHRHPGVRPAGRACEAALGCPTGDAGSDRRAGDRQTERDERVSQAGAHRAVPPISAGQPAEAFLGGLVEPDGHPLLDHRAPGLVVHRGLPRGPDGARGARMMDGWRVQHRRHHRSVPSSC